VFAKTLQRFPKSVWFEKKEEV